MRKNLGGDRLGSGAKMEVDMHGFQRSNHDVSALWKSTMAPGTLVPFMTLIGLPGDSFDIDLDSIVKTNPTIGPLFGSFKLQLDVFTCPIRLYNAQLHNNGLNIGYNMANVKFPILKTTGQLLLADSEVPVEFQQINQSSLLAYLGIRGLGNTSKRDFNAIPYLAYFDIFKNYYANKAEENAYCIQPTLPTISSSDFEGAAFPVSVLAGQSAIGTIHITGNNIYPENIEIPMTWTGGGSKTLKLTEIIYKNSPINWITYGEEFTVDIMLLAHPFSNSSFAAPIITSNLNTSNLIPSLQSFPLENLDTMRELILQAPKTTAFEIDSSSPSPYGLSLVKIDNTGVVGTMFASMAQCGLLVKTYQSDIFNNWLNTETQQRISDLSAITVTDDKITVDQINISKKIYDLLNRIMVSGGTYKDWIEASFDHTSKWMQETPMYCGGLSKEIIFEQITSTAATDGNPLGTLAGQGTMSHKHKGGKVMIRCDEPMYIMGIVSITPRIDYSQGNQWDVNLKSMDDLHKPNLDGIGFQDLITDQMAFADSNHPGGFDQVTFKSAGKQPAWINYMTNYNKSYGNFADPRSEMFMTLNRRYQIIEEDLQTKIGDLTTYIDPAKFNYAFAQSDLSSQNFRVQIAANIFARRKMSAQIMPNL